ncbi:MAG: hypothetical protein AB8G95_23880 [Anaerolineae bacterium]
MSSRNQRQLLQLSIATLFLFQVFYFFSPATASNFLNRFSFKSQSSASMRYELKVTSIDGNPLQNPILISDHWSTFGVDEQGSAQLLIDELARALSQNNLDKAQSVYTKLAEEHVLELDSYSFQVQQINLVKVPLKTGGFDSRRMLLNSWSSDEIRPTNFTTELSAQAQ